MLRSIILLFVAIFLGVILIPIGVLYTGFKKFFKPKYLAEIFYRMAYSIDQLGNTSCKYFFNDVLIKNDIDNPFGNPDETISSVLGKNYLKNNLTILGKILNTILDFLDTNHSVKSIEN
jgi:8-oxo-dGTP diphosphatase